MGRKYFGTDGIRGRANAKITADLALKVGQAAGLVFQRGEYRHRVVIGKDTRLSSYMIEYAMVGGLHLGRHGRPAARPGADAGGRDADPFDALRPRGDDLGLAQPFRGQRHQAVRPRRVQTLRRNRGAHRRADGRRHRRRNSPARPTSAAPSASTTCWRATSNTPSARCRATSRSTACASWSTAPTAPPTRSRPKRCGSSAPK